MKNVREFKLKLRDIWSFFSRTRSFIMGNKVFQKPIHSIREGAKKITRRSLKRQRRAIGSLAGDKQSSGSAIRKGAGTRQGVSNLRRNIIDSCNKLTDCYKQ